MAEGGENLINLRMKQVKIMTMMITCRWHLQNMFKQIWPFTGNTLESLEDNLSKLNFLIKRNVSWMRFIEV